MCSVQPKYGIAMTAAGCFWLGLFPLLQGGSYAHITKDKWIIMFLGCALTLLCFLFDFLRRSTVLHSGGAPVSLRLPLILGGLLLLWTLLSCLLSSAASEVWWLGESARREGLATRLCYFGLFFLFALSRVRLKPLLFSAAAGIAVFTVVVLLQRAGGNPLGLYPGGRSYAQNPEFQGTIGNVDMDTGYCCLLSGFLLYGGLACLPGRGGEKRFSPLCLCVCAAGLLLSLWLVGSMDVQFGVLTLSVLVLVTLLRFLPRKWRLPLLILLLAAMLLLVWFWPGTGGGIWELHEILHGRTRLSFGSNRIAVWCYTLGMSRSVLLLGGGCGAFPARFSAYLEENGLSVPTEQDGVPLPHHFDNPHNEYLSLLTDSGLPAALLFFALILAALFRRREGFLPLLAPCSAAVLCYAVQAFFSFSVCLVAPLFWVLLGCAFRDVFPACNASLFII